MGITIVSTVDTQFESKASPSVSHVQQVASCEYGIALISEHIARMRFTMWKPDGACLLDAVQQHGCLPEDVASHKHTMQYSIITLTAKGFSHYVNRICTSTWMGDTDEVPPYVACAHVSGCAPTSGGSHNTHYLTTALVVGVACSYLTA